MQTRFPFAHRIQRPREYEPALTSDIKQTFERERSRIAQRGGQRAVVLLQLLHNERCVIEAPKAVQSW